jgi:hypothetical protein
MLAKRIEELTKLLQWTICFMMPSQRPDQRLLTAGPTANLLIAIEEAIIN